VAAGKDQTEPVVLHAVVFRDGGIMDLVVQPVGELPHRRVEAGTAAQGVDALEAVGRDEPGAMVLRHASLGPLLQRGREGIVQCVLGEVEVAEQPHQRGEDAARVGTVDLAHLFAGTFGRGLSHAVRTEHVLMLAGAVAGTTPK
jgi:hypothetical protein